MNAISPLQETKNYLNGIQPLSFVSTVTGVTSLLAYNLFRPASLGGIITPLHPLKIVLPTVLNVAQIVTCTDVCGLSRRAVHWFQKCPPSHEKEALREQMRHRVLDLVVPIFVAGLNKYLQPLPYIMPAVITGACVAILKD